MKSRQKSSYAPLAQALQNIEFWLARDGVARLIAAEADFETMRRCELPQHARVSPRNLQGPRVAKRGSRTLNPGRTTLAIWPEDGVCEYAMPMLCFVVGGQADLRVADYVLHCRVGDMVYMPAAMPKCNASRPHFEGDVEGRSCDLLWIHPYIHPAALKCCICRSVESRHLIAQAGEHGFSERLFIQQVFGGICEEIEREGAPDTIARIMALLIHLLLRGIEENALLPSPDLLQPSQKAAHSPNSIAQACAYIDSHLEARLTIDDVARQVFLTPSLFTRHFRIHTAKSFKQYLTEQRLKKAKRLLMESDYTVEAVGRHVGLKSSQLRELFQKHCGCSPMEFRNKHEIS